MRYNPLGVAQSFGALAADRDLPARRAAEPLLHLIAMRGDHRPVADDRAIGIRQLPAALGEQSRDSLQHLDAVGTAPALVAVGKMHANVAEAGRTQHRIDDCVGHHIGVTMTLQRLLTGKPDPAQHQRSPTAISAIDKRMRVIPVPHPHHRPGPAVSSTHAS